MEKLSLGNFQENYPEKAKVWNILNYIQSASLCHLGNHRSIINLTELWKEFKKSQLPPVIVDRWELVRYLPNCSCPCGYLIHQHIPVECLDV